jgi:ADP-heptose:LPS heptosyltransferase
MHLAAAMGTPLVAVFGLSDPARYAPLGPAQRIVRIDLWCSPCNRVRRPPARCQGRVPDCLEGIGPDMVVRAGLDLLRPGRRASAGGTDQAGAREARA